MKDETPDTLHLPSFEEKVLANLESLSNRLASLEKREQERDYDTKPIWNRVLKEISELNTHMDNFDRKLDVMNKELLQIKADQQGLEIRLGKIEMQYPQILLQDRQF